MVRCWKSGSSLTHICSKLGKPTLAQNGDLSIFDLNHEIEIDTDAGAEPGPESRANIEEFGPALEFKAHDGSYFPTADFLFGFLTSIFFC